VIGKGENPQVKGEGGYGKGSQTQPLEPTMSGRVKVLVKPLRVANTTVNVARGWFSVGNCVF